MSAYTAPLKDIRYTLSMIADMPHLLALPKFADIDAETLDAVLEEAGRLSGEVLAPLNESGDRDGAIVENGVVRTAPGFKQAYQTYREGGWNGVACPPEIGGMGLPNLINIVCAEMWNSANMGFALCPLLNQGAIEALHAHGSDWLRQTFLPKMVSGEWSGTMNLTESHAGSDVGALRSRATPMADGRWHVKGTKIFITYGEHDYTENIIHLVLARTPGSPAGSKGISLFLVPKFLVNDDGSLGPRNDLRCVSLEHKLGIHASPTAVMSYGDDEGAIGYLIGRENDGMRCMFTMMNNARLAVGVQGVAIAERATQRASAYAGERKQGRAADTPAGESAPILRHGDVRRMLMTMKAYTEAARAICYANAQAIDFAHGHADPELKQKYTKRVGLMTPIAKAWSTDIGCEVASIGVQVHGGMGFIEETGAAQHMRDARILPIYEGTNGIQAMDLIGRKLSGDGGAAVGEFLADLRAMAAPLAGASPALAAIQAPLLSALAALQEATDLILALPAEDGDALGAVASPYLRMWGLCLGGALLARGAHNAQLAMADDSADAKVNTSASVSDQDHLSDRITVAIYFATQLLPQANALGQAIAADHATLFAIPPHRLADA